MKKYLFLFILTLLFIPSMSVYAMELQTIDSKVTNDNEILIQNEITKFLIKKNKNNIYDLTQNEQKDLVNYIEQYKKTLYPSAQPNWFNPWEYATTYDITGYIFASLDSSSLDIHYGHAGIGYSAGGNVIEANPGDGVKLYTNRVNSYWSKCQSGGVYAVNNAPSSSYVTAKNYAANCIGKGYGFDPIVDDFYCSELVYYAWDAAGYNIASSRLWGTPILPAHIMNDGDTVLKASFPF